ncbi:response regulator [Candidatus Gracilibacteria bacterium]|nr:response regulator [Candidatus Gracilibacteria bacterium]
MLVPLSRILIVEDDPDIQQLVAFALHDLGGMTVEVVETGQQALARVPVFAPDLVVLDWMLPDLDGIETFAAIRGLASYRMVPIVFLTAKARRDDVARLHALGAAAVLLKPFDPLQLAGEVCAIWEGLRGTRSILKASWCGYARCTRHSCQTA